MFNGRKLANLRKQKGMSQVDFAKKISLSPSTISMYEVNERQPDPTTIRKLADYFNVSTDYLLDNDEISKVAENQDDTQEIVERIKLMKYNELEKQLFKETGNLTDEQKRVILATVRAMNKEIIKEIDKEDNAN